MRLAQEILERRVLICVGSGGVGKTTTSAAIAVHAARAGRRVLVMTVDPARRLANALGIQSIGSEEQEVPQSALAGAGAANSDGKLGTLHAMMLDQKLAFDEVVKAQAKDPETVKKVLANPIYQQISTALAGAQEYAAMAKLAEVDRSGRYDFIVVDTPPTTNALDFLDAPQRISDAVDSPAVAWFVKAGGKGLGIGASFVLRGIAKFTGSGFLGEMSRFFSDAQDVLQGFRSRAEKVHALLRDPKVGFVVVTSPEPLALDEATDFHSRLRAASMRTIGFIVNRVHPQMGRGVSAAEAAVELQNSPLSEGLSADAVVEVASVLSSVHADLALQAEVDRESVERLIKEVGPTGHTATVPLMSGDVSDLQALEKIAEILFAQP